MKQALINDRLTPATPDAPSVATCPGCGRPVDLRRREQTWFWRHQAGAPRDCPIRQNKDWQSENDLAELARLAAEGVVIPTSVTRQWFTPVEADALAALIEAAQRVGADVRLVSSDTTLELTGPGVVILAARSGGQ